MYDEKEIRRYAENLFIFSKDYFTSRTSEELGISEDSRQEIIRMQNAKPSTRADDEFAAAFAE